MSPLQPPIPNFSSGDPLRYYESWDYSRVSLDQTPNLWFRESVEKVSGDQLFGSAHVYWYLAESTDLNEINDNDTIYFDTDPSEISLIGEIELDDDSETSVINTTLGVLSGVLIEREGSLVIPDSLYDPFSGPVDFSQFAWEFVDGIVDGDTVDVEVGFTNGDCDIMIWWTDTDNSTWSYSNNLVNGDMATGAIPEVSSFTADRSGRLAVGIFDYDRTAGQYTVTVDTRVGVYDFALGNRVESNLFLIHSSKTVFFEVIWVLSNGITMERHISGVRIVTNFNPEIENLRVSGAGAVKTIEWSISEQNNFNHHVFSILLSADEGLTFQLLDTNLTDTIYDWDSTGFLLDMYCVKVRALFASGLEVSAVSSLFDAGTVDTGGPIVVSDITTEDVEITPTSQVDTSSILAGFSFGITLGSISIIIIVLILTTQYYRKEL
ncbi:MAG: hypothetical protein ACFFF4_02715 [Candidatus Thorarchaeota archaeon]